MDFATINTLGLNDVGRWFRGQINSNKGNAVNAAASSLKAQTRVWTKALEKFISAYESLS
jgi:hypothetical protein